MENNFSSNNFYSGLLEWDTIKVFNVVLNIFIMVFSPLLFYSVIWYERFSADIVYRTLINQLLSNLCLIQIVGCVISRINYFIIYCLSPLPLAICDLTNYLGRWTFLVMMTQITLRQFIKYLYIFNWKCVASLNDDFFSLYITTWNIIFCTVFVFIAYFLGFHNEEPGIILQLQILSYFLPHYCSIGANVLQGNKKVCLN